MAALTPSLTLVPSLTLLPGDASGGPLLPSATLVPSLTLLPGGGTGGGGTEPPPSGPLLPSLTLLPSGTLLLGSQPDTGGGEAGYVDAVVTFTGRGLPFVTAQQVRLATVDLDGASTLSANGTGVADAAVALIGEAFLDFGPNYVDALAALLSTADIGLGANVVAVSAVDLYSWAELEVEFPIGMRAAHKATGEVSL